MKKKRISAGIAAIVRLACVLAIAAPLVCQDEARPYFTISSDRTFGSTETPSVMLSGWHVDAVQIRAYRINDPVKFFSELQDPHGFGSTQPRVGAKRTLLERIHNWKRSVRRSIRIELRSQFRESPSAHLRRIFPHKPAGQPQNRAAYFANAPVLNQDQLLLSFIQPLNGRTTWSSSTVPIPVKNKGLFLVEAVHGDRRAYTILMVSDIVLLTKSGRDHVLGWVADRVTGEPIPNANIAGMPPNGTAVTVATDANGLAEFPAPNPAPEDLRMVASRGSDFALNDIGSWTFSSRNRNWTGYIYTERPVYRPGDAMHFRGILRQQAAVGYEIPANKAVSVQIADPDGKAVYQKTLTTTANGIIHDDFAVPHNAPLGNYWIQIKAGENEMSGNFEVQEYKKPEYEVRVTPASPRVLEGEPVQASIDARYYFGEPVANAKVKYSVYRSRYLFPLWYEPDEDSAAEYPGDQYDDANSELISQADGHLDGDGQLQITVPTTVSDNKIDYRYRVQAEVTDKAGRGISGTGWIIATYGSFVLNVTPDRYFFEPSTNANFKVEARDYDNKPVSTAVHVELVTWDWRNRNKKGEIRSQADVRTDANGTVTAGLRIPSGGGSYRVLITARTPEGRTVQGESYVWVSAAGQGSVWGGPQGAVQIVPDKKTYQPGDTAKILIVTGQPNTPVLVTIEGRDIRSKTVLRSQGATALFQYTVSQADEPGLFVSAQFIRNGQLYQGQKRVKVPPRDHELNVKLSTDKPQYLPGQTAIYRVEVTTCDGKPAGRTDLSLGVVDEAVYAIRPDNIPDIVSFFYGREWNSVYTDNSLTYFFNGEAGTRRMRLAELRAPSQLAQLKPERLVQPKIRKAFPDTAFWAADLTTDSAGHALTRVEFPDSLTTWRATARGVSPGERFGQAVLKTIVRKNLIVRLALPRFFVQGDEVVISALVHNYLQTAKHARVQLQVQGLDILSGGTTQEVDVASRGEAKVDWRVKAQLARQAKITAEALTDEESDALEMDLPINPPGVPIREAKSGSISNSGSAGFSLAFPDDSVPGSRSLSIHLSSSIAGSIFGALQYLTSFPYGCVEQTMSSFLPDIMVTKAIKELGLKEPIDEGDLHQKIQAGLDRLYNFQHDDGGWGWWVSDASHPFMTAYVVAGLSEARADGISVRLDSVARGITWLRKALPEQNQLAPDLRAYMGYALALAGQLDPGTLSESYNKRSDLSPYGIAVLGLALDQVNTRASELASQLERSARQNESEAWWPASRDEMLDFTADVTPEATAYAMKLISRRNPNSPLLPKAALWLVNHRDEGYWWSSTKQTAMVIYGLVDYLKTTNELHPDFTATVSVNGQNAITHAFDSDTNTPAEIVLDEAKLQSGANQIQVSSQGQGRLYYSVSAVHNSDQARFEKEGAISLNLLRDYFRLAPTRTGDHIVYNLAALEGTVAQGDTIAVRLTVTGSEWRYLIVEDPIPSGTEFIENDNLYQIANKPPWWRYWFTRRELHDDRMAIFQTYFNEGQQQYFYLLKVVNPGLFHISPARVRPMYQPEHQATTEARTLEVK